MTEPCRNLVVLSDTHFGCRLALCGRDPVALDEGGTYHPSPLQLKLADMWDEFWDDWVPWATDGEPYAVVINGDALDGIHHNSVTQISHNLSDQANLAEAILRPIIGRAEGGYYHVRGTEAHVGKSGQEEERLAKTLGAIPDELGNYARFELWAQVGRGLAHVMHHIGTTGSSHYESSAVLKELTESYAEAGRWLDTPPDVIARSHRHRNIEVRIPTRLGYGIAFVTAGWQLKTPFTYRIPGGRIATPQIGGSLIRQGPHDFYTLHKVWRIGRPPVVTPAAPTTPDTTDPEETSNGQHHNG